MNTSTRDHHVPRMYLKRFAKVRGNHHQLVAITPDLQNRFATSVDNVAVESGFYWGTDLHGIPHHDLEEFLKIIESEASPAFRALLDFARDLSADALPRWPPRTVTRMHMSWWIAAQILRTVRQRERLDVTVDERDESIDTPRRLNSSNRHIRYITEMIIPLATSIFHRPWGIGYAEFCLVTGDVPTLVLNGQDHPDQLAAAQFWDVYLPLDPHRCLYLPGLNATHNPLVRSDHRFILHPGLVLALNSLVLDTAVRHIFFHPEHDPSEFLEARTDTNEGLPEVLLNYKVLPAGYGIEQRWLYKHPERSAESAPSSKSNLPHDPDEAFTRTQEMIAELELKEAEFTRFTTG